MKRAKLGELRLGDPAPVNPAEGVWVFPSYANLGAVDTGAGLVIVDLPIQFLFQKAWEALRARLSAPVHTVFLTHGHADHAFSLGPVFAEAEKSGAPRPNVIAQRNLLNRYRRYRLLAGFHDHINRIQFGVPEGTPAFPLPRHVPDILFDKSLGIRVGGLDFHAAHALGETDDALWVWVPEKGLVFAGDLVIWSFPNVGNPLKVQRFTLEWAEALETIVGKQPEILVPGHGSVLVGKERIRSVCLTVSAALRYLHDEVVKRLNRGETYEEILHGVKPLKEWEAHDFLNPRYGHPTFVVHGVLRQYAGWFDGNPSNLFPPPRPEVQAELARLIGRERLLERIARLKAEGAPAMALQLIDIALAGEADSEQRRDLHRLKAELLEALSAAEPSFIARNILLAGFNRELQAAGVPTMDDAG